MPVPMLDLASQNAAVKEAVLEGLAGLIDRSSFILGDNVKQLEAEIAAYAGARFCVGMSSGTDAQLVALMALGVGQGDEVIVPTFTFFATAGVVSRLGAKPVFVDLDPATFNTTGALVEAAITPRTKAIMPVHLFGQLAEMPAICKAAAKHGLPVIEDACQSLGASGWGRHAGQWGDMTAYSFYPTKNLGAFGDAGMTGIRDSEALNAQVRRLRVHGMEPVYVHHEVGMNGRIDEMQALVLRAKLPMLDRWHEGRREHAAWYHVRLKELTPGLWNFRQPCWRTRSFRMMQELRLRQACRRIWPGRKGSRARFSATAAPPVPIFARWRPTSKIFGTVFCAEF